MAEINVHYGVTTKQKSFMDATANEVLFGGAAGGGKSYAQLIDAITYSCNYPGSKQLILRRTYPELERSLIRVALEKYPRDIYSYNQQKHIMDICNGSLIEFGYCDTDASVINYQSAEYDTIRFDELTHFSEYQYTYLMSRLRGATPFPKQIKSATNPGGPGHKWVKDRFVDIGPPNKEHRASISSDGKVMTRIFIPALVQDNTYLMEADPDYLTRLENLPEEQKKALLYGDWDLFAGQYFTEFDRSIHVIEPFHLPEHWRRYIAIDYGLDMLAALWIAVSPQHEAVVYKELNLEDCPISTGVTAIHKMTDTDQIYVNLAPPDLWHREQIFGKTKAIIFQESGMILTKTSNDREAGWLSLKELLKINVKKEADKEIKTARLKIFNNCINLIKCLPELQHDQKKPTDVATEPNHEITHAPDALRAFSIYWHKPAPPVEKEEKGKQWREDQWEDYFNASDADKEYLRKKWGNPR